METKYIIFLTLIICLVFTFIAYRNEKSGVVLIVFSLSFLIPFQNNYIPIGLPGLLIIILTLINYKKSTSNNNSLLRFSKKFYYLYYLLFAGIIMGLYHSALGMDFRDADKVSNNTQIFHISTYFIVIVCFIKLLLSYKLDFQFQDKLIKVFCLSIIVHFLIYMVLKNTLMASVFFYVGHPENGIVNINEIRYLSLIGDYELTIDYVFITICYCLIAYFRKKKTHYLILLLLSIFTGVITGTRSFLIIGSFILLAILLTDFKKHKSLIVVLLLAIPVILSGNILISLSEKYTMFSRFKETVEQFNNNESVNKIANRDFSQATSDLVSNTNVLGNGSFNIYKFNGNEMVSHNLFLAMYAKFGLPGILILLGLLIFNIKLLVNVIRRPGNSLIKKESTLLLIILLGLILQELKISALRNISILLIYTFFLYNIYCTYLRNEVIKRWKSQQ